jgi:hypothetical protein
MYIINNKIIIFLGFYINIAIFSVKYENLEINYDKVLSEKKFKKFKY